MFPDEIFISDFPKFNQNFSLKKSVIFHNRIIFQPFVSFLKINSTKLLPFRMKNLNLRSKTTTTMQKINLSTSNRTQFINTFGQIYVLVLNTNLPQLEANSIFALAQLPGNFFSNKMRNLSREEFSIFKSFFNATFPNIYVSIFLTTYFCKHNFSITYKKKLSNLLKNMPFWII